MDFRDAPDDAAFRREVRGFLDAEQSKGLGRASGLAAAAGENPDSRRGGVDRYGVYRDWMKKLARKGCITVIPAPPYSLGQAGAIQPLRASFCIQSR